MEKRQILLGVLLVIIAVIAILAIVFLIRLFSARQLDDVSPGIPCDSSLLKKSNVLYVIPKFDNISILENKTWCEYILGLNKTLELHGVYHTYQEFNMNRDENYLNEGIKIFESCFNKTPDRFKPPHLAISKENKKMISKRMKLDLYFNQILHKVYHCNDSGRFKNKVIDWF